MQERKQELGQRDRVKARLGMEAGKKGVVIVACCRVT